MSQLGLMILAIGLSNYNASLFHLFTHAFFKALLFMSAGSIIHSISIESQDIRYFGGFLHFLPITYICFLIGSFTLMALPGLSGYYSKDIIIESSIGIYTISGFIIY
jgi:NADH-ubiquinone oxidoreductase chain 5